MDLRRRLVTWLGGLLAGLIAMALIINLHSLRDDIQAEVTASEELVSILLQAGQTNEANAAELKNRLAGAGLRHLNIELDASPALQTQPDHWLAVLLGIDPASTPAQTIHLGEQILRIAPNPRSEIEERLGDTVRLCITLLLFSGATLLVAWWSAERALAPVRELESGLHRLAEGATDARLPVFALREFNRVANAIDTLANALKSSRAAQHHLAQQLISVQEEEHRTLAAELHDEMGQTLTAISVTAAFLERNAGQLDTSRIIECAEELRRDIRTSGEQLRHMLKRLRPHGLDAAGLASALRELVGSWQQRESGIAFSLDIPAHLPPMDESVTLVLYRVVQEAMTNAVRHSGARHCKISITPAHNSLELTVSDDGRGLSDAATARRGGILGMEERLEMVGGTLKIDSNTASGLRLQANLPLTPVNQGSK